MDEDECVPILLCVIVFKKKVKKEKMCCSTSLKMKYIIIYIMECVRLKAMNGHEY